jgi:hypothetical protein
MDWCFHKKTINELIILWLVIRFFQNFGDYDSIPKLSLQIEGRDYVILIMYN